MLEKLIGTQLVSITEDGELTVKKKNKIYKIEWERDYGGCCGYTEVNATLLIDNKDLSNNPYIVNVETKDNENEEYECDHKIITLMGMSKPLCEISAEAGSGSGWGYGAYAKILCKGLKLEEMIVEW
jgi:hypothetical protein